MATDVQIANALALMDHLTRCHFYDFGSTMPDPEADGYAIDNLHEELHRRSDFGAHRHRLSSREVM